MKSLREKLNFVELEPHEEDFLNALLDLGEAVRRSEVFQTKEHRKQCIIQHLTFPILRRTNLEQYVADDPEVREAFIEIIKEDIATQEDIILDTVNEQIEQEALEDRDCTDRSEDMRIRNQTVRSLS